MKKHTHENQQTPKLKKGVLDHLLGHSWPGNIRELENVIERAIVLSEGSELLLDSFEFEPYQPSIEISAGRSLKEANDVFRRTYIINALNATSGNRTKAAKILQVQRSCLSRLIKELDID